MNLKRAYLLAWVLCVVFYFFEYVIRSAPAVMIPELAKAFDVTAVGVSSILGLYYYTYAGTSLVAGLLLDRFGAKYIVPGGALILGLGCLLFSLPNAVAGDWGRLLQGAGSSFAFTGAVYLASHGFPGGRLATAIGVTQCIGMLGGSAGQIGVGPLIHGVLSEPGFWVAVGVIVIGVALVLMRQTPAEEPAAAKASGGNLGMLQNYRVVLSNPQSYLCGLIAGLLFAPTTVLDMVWGVRYLQQDRAYAYATAVFMVSMVPLGWAIGCPVMGALADYLGRRKWALMAGMLIMLLTFLQLTFLRGVIPSWLSLLLFGVGSGAAMIPYTVIKEVNPDQVKGTATGVMNFITFSVTAVVGPIFAKFFGSSLEVTTDHALHLQHTLIFWIVTIVGAMLLTFGLRETGRAAR